jgi:hypothetical protein
MLMFENGLMATFIPDILMVVAFFLCLLNPSFKQQKTSFEKPAVVVQLSSTEQHKITGYQLSITYFQTGNQVINDSKPSLPRFIEKKIPFESACSTTEGIKNIYFSRPPPSLNI